MIGLAPFFFCHHALFYQQLNQLVDGVATGCWWRGYRLNRGSLALFWFRRRTFFPQHSKGRCEDCEVILVPEADGSREAVGEGGEIRGRPNRNAKEGFAIVGFAVLSEYIKAGEEGFAC